MFAESKLQRTVKLSIQGNEYMVKFPNVKQIIDIEALKAAYSNNYYGSMIASGTVSAARALDYIDILSTFFILIPELREDLQGVESLEDLDPLKAAELRKVYRKQFQPWYDSWMKLIQDAEKEDEEKEDEGVKETLNEEEKQAVDTAQPQE